MSLDRCHAVSVRFSITVGENCLCIIVMSGCYVILVASQFVIF